MSNSKSFVDHVVVVDIELVDVRWHRIEDTCQFEVDVEKRTCGLSGIQHPSCSRCKLVCLLSLRSYLFLPLSSPLIALSRVTCPLQGLLNDEPVLSFSSPHHPPKPGLRAQSPTFPLLAKEFGLCNCSSPGLSEKFARPQLQRRCQSWPAKRSKSSRKKGVSMAQGLHLSHGQLLWPAPSKTSMLSMPVGKFSML